MRKRGLERRSLVAVVSAALWKSGLARRLKATARARLARIEARLVRRWCFILMAGMLMGDVILLLRAGKGSRAAPHYSVIRTVATVGEQQRHPTVKAFGLVWDSLLADPAVKRGWDSLLRVRPGLDDTVRELQRLDSAVSGK
jgi:hypothetical protein